MVVVALPGSLPDGQACQLVLHLARALVLVAGPPESWLVPDLCAYCSCAMVVCIAVAPLEPWLVPGVYRPCAAGGACACVACA